MKLTVLVWMTASCLTAFSQEDDADSTAEQNTELPRTASPATALTDPDKLPARPIGSLNRDDIKSSTTVHVRGTVLDQRVGEYIVIRDDTGTVFVETPQTLTVKLQTMVDVWGTPAGDENRITLRNSNFRLVEGTATAASAGTAQKPAELPLLTKVRQVRELMPEQAGWEYPVKLRATVTFNHPPPNSKLYICDDTSGIYVRVRGIAIDTVKPGDVVEIDGVSNPGWFMPVVVPTNITVVGNEPLPEPRETSLFQLASGQLDAQWVEAHAVVRSVKSDNGLLQLKLSDRDGTFLVNIPSSTAAPTNLVDAVVRVRGVCVSQFNTKRQITGVTVWAQSLDFVQIEESGTADPLSTPAQPIIGLSQFHPREILQRRVKVAGIVTLSEPGQSFFVQDAEDGLQVFTSQKLNVKPGDRISVAGYPALGNYGTVLRDAIFEVTGHENVPAPKTMDPAHPLDPQLHGNWVQVEARLLSDSEVNLTHTMKLQFGSTIFEARCVAPEANVQIPRVGSMLNLTGVYRVLADEARVPSSFQLMLPSVQSIKVLETPSRWGWISQHTIMAAGMAGGTLAVIAGVAILWVLILRRKVHEQTAILQQNESKFRSLVEQSFVGVYIIQDGRFVYVNPRLANVFGYTPEEMVSCQVQDTVHPDDWQLVDKSIENRLAGEEATVQFHFRGRCKDGSEVLVEVLGTRSDYDGKPAVLGTLLDITERKRAEYGLAEASSLLDALLDNIPDYIYFKDSESRFVRCSKSFEKLFNLADVRDLKGKSDFDFFLKEHAQHAFDDEQTIMRSGEPLIGKLEREQHPDGRVTQALTTKMPWRDRDGKVIGTFGISKDVTGIKETEARLEYERDLFRALLENFPDIIYFKDLQSRFVRVSRSKAERSMAIVLGNYKAKHPSATPEQLPPHLTSLEKFTEWLTGKTDFDTFVKERAQAAYEDEQEIIRTGNPVLAKVERTPQADGKVTWCISTKMPWRNKDGKTIGTFGVSKDITALKEAEAELESTHKRLIETSRLAGMAEVATDVLHNVGNVLNSVNVSCSLTIDRVKASKISSLAKVSSLLEENRNRLADFFANDPRGQQIPGYIAALTEHFGQEQSLLLQELEQLIKHIDHIKQIVAMQQSYAKVAGVIEAITPAQLVEDALHINAAALTRHDVQVQRDFSEAPPIHTEKHKVLQILVNLIRNAKYALDDSKRTDKIMTIKITGNGDDHIKIQVIDNGVGIPPENLTRIFGHGFTTRRNGHGFGLHSSALAIKELGGSLQAHSDGVGKGAVFTLLLPQNPQGQEKPA